MVAFAGAGAIDSDGGSGKLAAARPSVKSGIARPAKTMFGFMFTSLYILRKNEAVGWTLPVNALDGRVYSTLLRVRLQVMPTLRSSLAFEPRELAFGTSGRRGLIRDLTDLEISINISAEIQYLKSLAPRQGGVQLGDEVFLARDLRPSSERIGCVIQYALRQLGMHPVNLGEMPTPALTWFAVDRGCASIMVTGSHIPFDRNGYKLNTTRGELLKEQEAPINALVRTVRELVYAEEFAASSFAADGSLRITPPALDAPSSGAVDAWIHRYTDFAGNSALAGKRILVYQHSAVGRDLLVDILRGLGAEPVPVGRSESFVPIDTENIGEAELSEIRRLYSDLGPAWAVVSTDGDIDRPLLLAPDPV